LTLVRLIAKIVTDWSTAYSVAQGRRHNRKRRAFPVCLIIGGHRPDGEAPPHRRNHDEPEHFFMSSEPLYSSKIFATYLKLVRRNYGYVDTPQILDFAGIKPQEVHDPNHWFSRHHLDRFYEKVVEMTGEAHIAREAGRFLAAPEAVGFLRHYVLGMVSPTHAFKTLQRGPTHLSRSCHIDIQPTASNQVEITVQPRPGVQEPPSLCLFRTGLFEAIVTTFNLEMPEIEHTECLLKGDDRCRYLIKWKNSICQTLQKVRNLCGLGALAGSAAT
jgi:hypothetical protein